MAGLPLGMAPYAHANNDAGASATTLLLGRLLPRSAAAFASMAEQRAG
jgi:hypothetical protein